MLKINRKVEYGLVAMKHMHGKPKDELTSVREICEIYNTPFDPVAHVLRILNSEGILQSEQGAHGGYRLVESLKNISLAQFIEMIDGHLHWTDCSREKNHRCTIVETCNIVGPMRILSDRLVDFLGSITLWELIIENGSPLELNQLSLDTAPTI